MRFRNTVCFTILITGAFSICFSSGAEPPDAQTLLKKAREITAHTSFSSEMPVLRNGVLRKTIKLYRKGTENGIMQERVENLWTDSSPEWYIANKSGVYAMLGEKKIKIKRSPSNRSLIFLVPADEDETQATYTIQDGVYMEEPCYKVTVTLPAKQDRSFKIPDEQSQTNSLKAEPIARTYLIDKTRNFIYGYSAINSMRKQIFSCNWGKVDFQTPIDNKLFEVPAGVFESIKRDDRETLQYVRTVFYVNNSMDTADGKLTQEDLRSNDVRKILFAAMRETRNTNFQAIRKIFKGGKYRKTIRVYHNPMPDGSIRERVEHCWNDSWQEVYIINGTNYFSIINRTSIKTFVPYGSRRFLYANIRNDVAENATYSLENSSYKGHPCYQITVKIPTDPQSVKDRIARVKRYRKKSEDELRRTLPFAKTFLVDRKSNFIYTYSAFNLLGRRIIEEEWGDVTFSPSLNEKLFTAPKGKIQSVLTARQFNLIRERCVEEFKQDHRTRK